MQTDKPGSTITDRIYSPSGNVMASAEAIFSELRDATLIGIKATPQNHHLENRYLTKVGPSNEVMKALVTLAGQAVDPKFGLHEKNDGWHYHASAHFDAPPVNSLLIKLHSMEQALERMLFPLSGTSGYYGIAPEIPDSPFDKHFDAIQFFGKFTTPEHPLELFYIIPNAKSFTAADGTRYDGAIPKSVRAEYWAQHPEHKKLLHDPDFCAVDAVTAKNITCMLGMAPAEGQGLHS